MTLWYWQQTGGTLIEEFPVIGRGTAQGLRLLDGLIVLDGETFRMPPRTLIPLRDRKVVVVQAKNNRLGMSLAGQTLFSLELVRKHFDAANVTSIALCSRSDAVLQPILEAHAGCRVIVCPDEVCRSARLPGMRRKEAST